MSGGNHKHGRDPNNTDDLVDTAEAIDPLPHPPTPDTNTTHPLLLPPQTQNDRRCLQTDAPTLKIVKLSETAVLERCHRSVNTL